MAPFSSKCLGERPFQPLSRMCVYFQSVSSWVEREPSVASKAMHTQAHVRQVWSDLGASKNQRNVQICFDGFYVHKGLGCQGAFRGSTGETRLPALSLFLHGYGFFGGSWREYDSS